MYRIGIIDDTDEMLNDYIKRLRRNDIELLVAPDGTMEDIKQWIVKNYIKCMLIDYCLSVKYDFNGTEFAFYLDDALQGLPYLILTSYPEPSVDEKMVVASCIKDRSVMDRNSEEFQEFCNQLKQSTEVFDKTMQKYKRKYAGLLQKKQQGTITQSEEEEFVNVFRILKSYNEVDDIPSEMLKSSLSDQLDTVLEKLDCLLKNQTGE